VKDKGMADLANAFTTALILLLNLDDNLLEIVLLSLQVSVSAVVLAALCGFPLGAGLALFRFPGRTLLVVLINALMGLPPVVVGLTVYLVLSRSGPLGGLGLLFTLPAMIFAQWILVTPIVAAMTRQLIEDLWSEYGEQLRSLGTQPHQAVGTLLWEGRYRLFTAVLAGFGRAIAEVGAVLIVGGNIAHATRVMTTAIALETARGDLALALGLGIILILLSLLINALVYLSQDFAQRFAD
jgi:tungstate transport system permease protein